MAKNPLTAYTNQLSFDYAFDDAVDEHSESPQLSATYLAELLRNDLDFHEHVSRYASHAFHAFPAKFPPQLPAKFIRSLTKEGDVVLDPMMGSGTTVLEAFLTNRRAIGFDIDHLAIRIAKVKTASVHPRKLAETCRSILDKASRHVKQNRLNLLRELSSRWDAKSREFLNYWFAKETQIELLALLLEIENIHDEHIRTFFEVAFSAVIITKSGGVSLALDLAHTRPHKAKIIKGMDGIIIEGRELDQDGSARLTHLTKKLRPTFVEFEKRCFQNIKSLMSFARGGFRPRIEYGDAQAVPLESDYVDLIVTSPPYASNAIDYMRAHKFSLVWLGYSIEELTSKRKEYIGSEDTLQTTFESLPSSTAKVVSEMKALDQKRGRVLHRYYSEMKRTLQEMYRVLKPNGAAIVVVGRSIMKGKDTQTHYCLAEIGQEIGFEIPEIGIRKLDRNKRMMPASKVPDTKSQIQQRMHLEYVIGFYKP